MKCRHCGSKLDFEFIDLVSSPPSNSFLKLDQLNKPEVYYPLKLFVCEKCLLVQVDEYKSSCDIFNNEYVYFSSYSKTWVEHAKNYVNMIVNRLKLNEYSQVMEIASNDGYLLQFFNEKNIPNIGIEPTANTANVAKKIGIEVIQEFFGSNIAKTLPKADLILGNNVLAHVPDVNDFVGGLKITLKTTGTITMEFPHILNLIKYNQFDTIYHEHFSYFSLLAVKRIFESCKLKIYDVEELPTHGGSLRIYATHLENKILSLSSNIKRLIKKEMDANLHNLEGYKGFQKSADEVKYNFLEFLLKTKKDNKRVIAYGAAAKGNTLLNYCGIKKDFISFVSDISPYKQGLFLPGSHIPVCRPDKIKSEKPDFIIIIPWNLKDEIIKQNSYIRDWGGKFVTAIPRIEIF